MKRVLLLSALCIGTLGGPFSVLAHETQQPTEHVFAERAFHAASPTTPKPGSALRKKVLDALRIPVTKFNKGQRITFTSVDLRVQNGWAYVQAATVDDKGKRVGPPFTNFVSGLLHQKGPTWSVTEWAYATDVISIDWEQKHPQVPRALWPHHR